MAELERRRHPRVPVQIDVAYDNDVFLVNATLRDLSAGGAMILTEAPLPVGTRLSLTFRGEEAIDLSAQVLRVAEEDPDEPAEQPGMAVEFTGVSAADAQALAELIASYRESEILEETVDLQPLEAPPEAAAEEPPAPSPFDAPAVASPFAMSEGASPFAAPAPSPFDAPSSGEFAAAPVDTDELPMVVSDVSDTIVEGVAAIPREPEAELELSLEQTVEGEVPNSEIPTQPQMPIVVADTNGAPEEPGQEKRGRRKKKR